VVLDGPAGTPAGNLSAYNTAASGTTTSTGGPPPISAITFAQTDHISRIGFWSAGRDNGGCPNGSVSPTCSGIGQSAYEFTDIFKAFTG
jgi:hypothetical protein